MPMHIWAVTHGPGRKPGQPSEAMLGYATGLLAWMLAGSVFVVVKLVAAEMPPWTMVCWRALIASLAMLPFVYRDLVAASDMLKERWLALFLIGGLGFGLTQGVMFTSLHLTTAMNVGIIFALAPMLVLILAAIVLGEPMNGWQGLGSLIAFCGIVFIAVEGSLARLLAFQVSLGDLVVLLSTIMFAVYTVSLKKAKFELNAMALLTVLLFTGSVTALPFSLVELFIGDRPHLSFNGYLALFYCAIFGGSILYLFYNLSIGWLGAGRAGTLVYTQPLFCTFFAWLVLHERLAWYHIAGGAAVALGILFVLMLGPKSKPGAAGN